MNDKYILDEHGSPLLEPDPIKWAQWYESNDKRRRVARDQIGNIVVSTVFLGLDHQFCEGEPPLLFETMIFGGEHDQEYQERYSTRIEAMTGHAKAVNLVRNSAH